MKTIQEIYTIFTKVNINNLCQDFYTESYPHYLNYFSNTNQLSKQDLIIGISLVYSWMPTIPKNVDFSILNQVLPVVNKAKQENILIVEDYKILKQFCNNSLVGASKLLHFINPKAFAIWDSNIYSFLYQDKTAYKYRVEDINKYIEYLELLKQISSSVHFHPILDQTKKNFNYSISNFRAIEWLIFSCNSFKN